MRGQQSAHVEARAADLGRRGAARVLVEQADGRRCFVLRMIAQDLYWEKPPDLPLANLENIVAFFNASTWYEATFARGPDLSDGRATGRVKLVARGSVPAYLEAVALGEAASRWEPLEAALRDSQLYRDEHADAKRAAAAIDRIEAVGTKDDAESLHEWLEEFRWVLGRTQRDELAKAAVRIEPLFASRFGDFDPLAYCRSYRAFAAFQAAEVLAKFEVMNPADYARASAADRGPNLVLEDGPHHGNANFLLTPMSVAFPRWMGTWTANVSYWVAFVLRTPRPVPLFDSWHRDIWSGWIGSWYDNRMWEPLLPNAPRSFVAWYIRHLNQALGILLDLRSTATTNGAIRPMSQLAMTRFFFNLQDLIGRLCSVSDPYTRLRLTFQVLDHFNELGWNDEVLAGEESVQATMQPLHDDPDFGSFLGEHSSKTWGRAMRGIADGAEAEFLDGMTKMRLANGSVVTTRSYLAQFLRQLRNTIHGFREADLRRILGVHSGRLPLALSHFMLMLWLRLLVDPAVLARAYRH